MNLKSSTHNNNVNVYGNSNSFIPVFTVLSTTSLGFFFFVVFFFALRFILNENMFCLQIFTLKLNLRPKLGLTYAISIVK